MTESVERKDETNFARLRSDIEAQVDRKIRTPKDFDFLSACIAERLHQTVSTSTLKRVWSYVASDTKPRLSTLDILAQFIGYHDWEDYCASDTENDVATEQADLQSPSLTSPQDQRKPRHNGLMILLAVVAVSLVVGILYLVRESKEASDSPHIIRQGDTFATYDDIHRLFGIHVRDTAWWQAVPRQDGLYVWCPQHHHPQWHNEGDSSRLFPTIAEYLTFDDNNDSINTAIVNRLNAERYNVAIRFKELRLTFMRGLRSDSAFTFLGAYRISVALTDTTRTVWERVALDIDLEHLDNLQKLRN